MFSEIVVELGFEVGIEVVVDVEVEVPGTLKIFALNESVFPSAGRCTHAVFSAEMTITRNQQIERQIARKARPYSFQSSAHSIRWTDT